MPITSDDLAAWARDGLDLGVSDHRQVIVDQLVDCGRETDVRLVDDHADLAAMALDAMREAAQARRSLCRSKSSESIRARILGLTRTADAWSSLCAVLRMQRRWSAVPPDERECIIVSLGKRGHIVETASLVANTGREVMALVMDRRPITAINPMIESATVTVDDVGALAAALLAVSNIEVVEWRPPSRGKPRSGHWRLYVDFVPAMQPRVGGFVDVRRRMFTMQSTVPTRLRAKVQAVRDVVERWAREGSS